MKKSSKLHPIACYAGIFGIWIVIIIINNDDTKNNKGNVPYALSAIWKAGITWAMVQNTTGHDVFDMRYWWITEWNQIKWANKVSWKRRGAQIRQHQDHRPTGHNIVNWLDTYKKWTVYLRIIPFRKLEKSSCHYRQPDIIVLYDHATLKMLHHDPSNILRRIISL